MEQAEGRPCNTKNGLWVALQQADFCRTGRAVMPRVSTAHCPIPGTTILSTVKQMSSFRTGCTSGQITNSRKTIHWYYTGFRKGGRLFPIPLATVLKSACMTLENKQDIMSVELLFPRQLIPPQPDGITAGEAAQPSSDLKKLHHPFHWT